MAATSTAAGTWKAMRRGIRRSTRASGVRSGSRGAPSPASQAPSSTPNAVTIGAASAARTGRRMSPPPVALTSTSVSSTPKDATPPASMSGARPACAIRRATNPVTTLASELPATWSVIHGPRSSACVGVPARSPDPTAAAASVSIVARSSPAPAATPTAIRFVVMVRHSSGEVRTSNDVRHRRRCDRRWHERSTRSARCRAGPVLRRPLPTELPGRLRATAAPSPATPPRSPHRSPHRAPRSSTRTWAAPRRPAGDTATCRSPRSHAARRSPPSTRCGGA